MENVDICYVISHGFAARMLTQTGLILQLIQKGLKIAVITVDPDEKSMQLLAEKGATVIKAPIQRSWKDENYDFKRRYYLEDIASNPVFREKHRHSLLYSKSKHPWKRIRPLYYLAIHHLINVLPGIKRRFRKSEAQLLKSSLVDNILKKMSPSLLVCTYPINYLECKFAYSAKQGGIDVCYHLLSWDNITSKGIFPVSPDHFIVWGPIMEKEVQEYYDLPSENVYKVGVPHFDLHLSHDLPDRDHVLKNLSLNPARPYLFFAMSAPRFAPNEIGIVEWLAEQVEKDEFGSEMQLIIRPHPQNIEGNFAAKSWQLRLNKLQSSRTTIHMPSLSQGQIQWSMERNDMEELASLLSGAAVVLNSGSTVSIDAMIHDRPVILTSFDGDHQYPYWKSARRLIDYTHLAKLVNMKGVWVTHDFSQLKEALNNYVESSFLHREERRETIRQECYIQDGKATQRAVRAILKLLEN